MRRKSNKLPKLHLKKGDRVQVLSGDDKGKVGEVLQVYPQQRKALVEGVNLVTKHTKPNQQKPEGARETVEAPLYVSKLMLVDPSTGEATRIGRQKTEKGWVRISKKSGNVL